MQGGLRLLAIIGEAALLVATAWFGLVLALSEAGFNPGSARLTGELFVAAALVLMIGGTAWWVFRRLQPSFPRREARATSIAFVLSTPVSFLIGILLAQIPGSYANLLIGPQFFGLVGAFIGIVVVTALLSFLVCALALWITRRIARTEA